MSVAATIASAQREVARVLLRDRCDVVTPAKGASDGRFGWAAGTPETAHSNAPCLIDRRAQDVEESVAQRLQGRSFVTVHLEPDRTVTMAQTIERRGTTETYEVIGAPTLATNGLTLEVPCARNTP